MSPDSDTQVCLYVHAGERSDNGGGSRGEPIGSAFGCFGICLLDARQTARAIQLIEDGSDGNFLNSRAQIAITLASEEIGNGRLEHDIAALFARLP